MFKLLAAFLLLSSAASAHDWYPPECCSAKDCAVYPAEKVRETPGGYLLESGVTVPYKQARPSPDRQYHICTNQSTSRLICFFAVQGGV